MAVCYARCGYIESALQCIQLPKLIELQLFIQLNTIIFLLIQLPLPYSKNQKKILQNKPEETYRNEKEHQADPHDPIVIHESNASESGGRAYSRGHHNRAGSDRETISRASVHMSSRREKLGDEFNSTNSGELQLENQTDSVKKEKDSIERYEEE